MTETTNNNRKPADVVRAGSLKATIWRNVIPANGGNGESIVFNTTFSRSYRRGDEWQESSSYGVRDLLVLSKLASDVETRVRELQGAERQGEQKPSGSSVSPAVKVSRQRQRG